MECVDAQETTHLPAPNANDLAEARAEAVRAAKDLGYGFGMGTLGGFAYHLLGETGSVAGAMSLARFSAAIKQAPFTGMRFAGWYGLHQFIKSELGRYREKTDSFNSFVSAATVGGLATGLSGPFVASTLLLGSGVALFDSALDRWYYKKERSDEKMDDYDLPEIDPFPHFELTNQFLMG